MHNLENILGDIVSMLGECHLRCSITARVGLKVFRVNIFNQTMCLKSSELKASFSIFITIMIKVSKPFFIHSVANYEKS